MSKPILLAACISMLTFIIHVFMGGPEIHDPILNSNATDLVKAVGSVVWHAISAILIINAVALWYAAKDIEKSKSLIVFIIVQYFAFVVLFLGYGIARFGSIFVMPQWTLFLPMCVLALWGAGSRTKSSKT